MKTKTKRSPIFLFDILFISNGGCTTNHLCIFAMNQLFDFSNDIIRYFYRKTKNKTNCVLFNKKNKHLNKQFMNNHSKQNKKQIIHTISLQTLEFLFEDVVR